MIIGEVNKLKVLRRSDIGYMLSDGRVEVLMHFKEATRELKENENIEAFLYLDKLSRICATMNEVYVTLSKPNFVKVCDVSDIGVYVDNNCSKDLLVSKDYLPYDKNLWPQIGDTLYCELKVKNDTMTAKVVNRDDLIFNNEKINYALKEEVSGYVMRIMESGVGVFSKDRQYLFIHKKHMRGDVRLGFEVKASILYPSEYGYTASLIAQKEKLMESDALIIVEYLKAHNNKMTLTAKSDSEEVFKVFKMSRKAFKRALGSLYKEQIIECREDETILKVK